MQSAGVLTQQRTDYAERVTALNGAVDRVLTQIFGCYHRNLSRPFTRDNKTYRVCMSCGMGRSFDLESWKTVGRATRIH